MANLTLKGIPDDLYDQLKARAAENRRSLNSEAIVALENAVREGRAGYGPLSLAEIRAFRATLDVPPLTDEFLERAIGEGRP